MTNDRNGKNKITSQGIVQRIQTKRGQRVQSWWDAPGKADLVKGNVRERSKVGASKFEFRIGFGKRCGFSVKGKGTKYTY